MSFRVSRPGLAINDNRGIVRSRRNRPLYANSEVTFLWRAREKLPGKVVPDFRFQLRRFWGLVLGRFILVFTRQGHEGVILVLPNQAQSIEASLVARGKWS